MISSARVDACKVAAIAKSITVAPSNTLSMEDALYLRRMLEASGLTVVNGQAAMMLAGVYDYDDPQRLQTDIKFAERSGVSIACETGASVALALDLGVEVAAALMSLEASIPRFVCVTVPTRMRSFAPVLAAASQNRTRAANFPPLQRRFQGFRTAASRSLPTEQDVLRSGRIAIAVAPATDPASAHPRWARSLTHLLEKRWTGSTCACCA